MFVNILQIVAFEGNNSSGQKFIAKKIYGVWYSIRETDKVGF